MVFGPQTIHRLPEMLDSRKQNLLSVVDVTFPEVEKFDRLPEPKMDGPSAFVSIMEGCSKYCSFCVVPYTRGEEVSRSVDSVLQEVRGLVAQGVREIHLLGQNVNSYGKQENKKLWNSEKSKWNTPDRKLKIGIDLDDTLFVVM